MLLVKFSLKRNKFIAFRTDKCGHSEYNVQRKTADTWLRADKITANTNFHQQDLEMKDTFKLLRSNLSAKFMFETISVMFIAVFE